MNAVLRNAIATFEKLSPEDQEQLAREMEARAQELWLEGELARGEASGGEIPVNEVFDRIAARHSG